MPGSTSKQPKRYLTPAKTSNGRKIASIARSFTILGPKKSQRRDLFFENFVNEGGTQKLTKTSKICENFRKKIEKLKIFTERLLCIYYVVTGGTGDLEKIIGPDIGL